jgi:hypothetical protein
MTQLEPNEQLQPGDLVVIKSHHIGDHGRTGEILELLGEPGHEHFKVLWEDGRETIFFPSNDAVIERVARTE